MCTPSIFFSLTFKWLLTWFYNNFVSNGFHNSLSEKDKSYVEFAIKHDIDFIAHSFVRNKQDVKDIQDMLDAQNSKVKIFTRRRKKEKENDDATQCWSSPQCPLCSLQGIRKETRNLLTAPWWCCALKNQHKNSCR